MSVLAQPPGWSPVRDEAGAVTPETGAIVVELYPAQSPPAAGAPAGFALGRLAISRVTLARRVALGGVLALSATLQFYRLDEWQYFSDDQATQLNVMHGLLADHHVPLLGLALSVGKAHLGPLFYYLLALPLWLGHVNPTAGVAVIGLFQVGTVYLLYRLLARVGAPWAGLCAATLYATSGLVVYWSRFLWPNIAPFFALLALYALLRLAQGEGVYLILLVGSLAAAAQLQPTALLLTPVAALWLVAARTRFRPRVALAALATAALLYAPVIIYDLTHRFAELRAWLGYVTALRPAGGHGLDLARGFDALEQFGQSVLGLPTTWATALLAASALATLASALGMAGWRRAMLAHLLLLWGSVFLLAFSLYHGALHPHYFEPLYPLPFLALGLAVDLVICATPRAALEGARKTLAGWERGIRRLWRTVRGLCYAARRQAHAILAEARARRRGLGRGLMIALTAALVLSVAAANTRRLWADHFMLDATQLDTPAAAQGNEITLGEMRQAATLITRDARGQPYSFWLAVRDGANAYLYVQRQKRNSPAGGPRPLRYLLVEPSDRPAWLWPAAIRNYWRLSHGAFALLPHVLVWRMTPARTRVARSGGPWRIGAALDGPVTALAAPQGHGRRLLAGFIGGAAISADGGHTWRRAAWPRGAPNGLAVISSFAWSAACPRQIYAGAFDGVVTSRDGGATWTRLPAQPASTEILSLLADPWRCGVLLAGTRGGVARTDDGGRRWSMSFFGGAKRLAAQALVLDTHANVIYAGTADGVWMSRDGGRSWPRRRQSGEPRPALALLVHPFGAQGLIAGTGAGVALSGPGGASWTRLGAGLNATVYALLPARDHSQGVLLAGTEAGLYRSHDGGASWTRAALPADLTVSAFARVSDHLIYAATNQGVYRSTNGGGAWARP